MTSLQSDPNKPSEREETNKRCRSRDYSPSSTQVNIKQEDASTLSKGSTRNKRDSNGDDTVYTPRKYERRKDYQRDSSTDSSTSSTSVESNDVKSKNKSERRYSKTKSSRKEGKYRDNQPATHSRPRDRSPRSKKSPEHVPYFIDPKREEDRLRRKYGESSRSRRRSASRTRRRSHTRKYSRERHRSKSRERRRSFSCDRHRSRRRSRSPGQQHEPPRWPGGPPFIPVVPVPYPPHFVTAPYPPRFPHGAMLRPPFPPPVVYYVPHPMFRPMGRWMNRPVRPRRND